MGWIHADDTPSWLLAPEHIDPFPPRQSEIICTFQYKGVEEQIAVALPDAGTSREERARFTIINNTLKFARLEIRPGFFTKTLCEVIGWEWEYIQTLDHTGKDATITHEGSHVITIPQIIIEQYQARLAEHKAKCIVQIENEQYILPVYHVHYIKFHPPEGKRYELAYGKAYVDNQIFPVVRRKGLWGIPNDFELSEVVKRLSIEKHILLDEEYTPTF